MKSRSAAQPIACDHGMPFRDRCDACERHYDADRSRLEAIEAAELQRKERTRAVSAEWKCDACGALVHFYEPGPASPSHHGTRAGWRPRDGADAGARCGGTWSRA